MEVEHPIFSFPFKPYPIQEKFMKELYSAVESSKPGIFESPTGTGKSLSICCSIIQWLHDHERKKLENLENEISKCKDKLLSLTDGEDWLQGEYEKIQIKQALLSLTNQVEKLKKRQDMYKQLKTDILKYKISINKSQVDLIKEKNKSKSEAIDSEPFDEDLIIDEVNDGNISDENDDVDIDEQADEFVKVFISSRTHSQLSQFVGEIKKTIFNNNTRVVTLASRQHFCINNDVNRLKNINLINERCLELQKSSSKTTNTNQEGQAVKKSKTKSCTSCLYYNQTNLKKLKDQMLVEIMDMEDIVKCGKELKACPYYATRMALEDAQVILISHAGVVSAGARSGINLKLDNNILIVDEAHGLSAALENAHSAPITAKQLTVLKTYLTFYINKYRTRLNSKNLLTLNQLNFVVGRFIGILKSKLDSNIYTLEDFVIKSEIDNLNLRPLIEFSRKSKLAPKLHGFSIKYNKERVDEEIKKNANVKNPLESFLKSISSNTRNEENKIEDDIVEKPAQVQIEVSAGSCLYALLDFLERLCDRSENGRVFITTNNDNGQLKYLLLNPAELFSEVVRRCRSVIVAGGTMEPISEFKSLISNSDSASDIAIVRCDHVVPADNVLGVCLSKGPTNVNLNFCYENRASKELLDEIGRILRNVCSIVPGGVVCFLPSYSYEKTLYEHLSANKIFDIISKKKTIFREPKDASEVDKVLFKYSKAIENKDNGINGALLLSVVGGKLSEGLNFSDDLGRCVMVVGMPYPNIKSAELQEKLNYMDRTSGSGAGNIYYENLCMKAVNQCIGRAVRHVNDYASVLLIDERYSRPQTVAALPSFVQKSLLVNQSFGPSVGAIGKFFSKHKKK